MKSIWSSWLLAVVLVFGFSVAWGNNLTHPAQIQMQKNAQDIMSVINNTALNNPQKVQRLNQYADRYLDYQRIAALSVGAPWRQFSAQQKQDFIAAFKQMIIHMYSNTALLAAKDAQIAILPRVSSDNTNTQARVYTQIVNNKNKSYLIDYQLYKADGVWKIYNINVEGTSLVTVYRSQFNEIINKQGIDGLIQTLKNKGIKVR